MFDNGRVPLSVGVWCVSPWEYGVFTSLCASILYDNIFIPFFTSLHSSVDVEEEEEEEEEDSSPPRQKKHRR